MPAPFGVYVHIPFCVHRCDYCAFATWTDRGHLVDAYVRACRTEVERASLPAATSVFFGGGTPSLLEPAQLAAILDVVERRAGAEVTVECNPETVDASKLAGYRDAGVNRLSFGVQSTRPHVLQALGRRHDAAAVARAARLACELEFPTWNADLIFGAAGESDADWARTLDDVGDLGAPHISAYALTVEAGTPLWRDPSRHPDDDVQAGRYLAAAARFRSAGFVHYEVSNWARPGHECAHNRLYWQQGNYRGIGAAAHSHDRGRRWWNVRTPDRYIDAITNGAAPVAGEEILDDEARRREALILSLRTDAGVPAEALASEELGPLVVPSDGGRVRLTDEGLLLANEVAVRLR